MVYFLLSLLIFLTPFIINPFFGYFFETPKVIFAESLIELLLLVMLFKESPFLKHLNRNHLILSGILIALTIFDLIFLGNLSTFFGNEFRLQGIFLFWHLITLSLISSKLSINLLPKVLFPICLGFLALTAILVEPDINGRAVGTLGEANALAASAIFFWPLALNFSWNKFRGKDFKLALILIALIIIALSGSDSGLLAFFLQILFYILLRWIGFKKAAVVTVIIIFLSQLMALFQPANWYENRAEIWQTALFAGSQNILGNGFGNIEQALSGASLVLNNNIRFQSVDSSHNILLDFWVEGGIIGLITFILLIFLSLKGLVKNLKITEAAVFLGLICIMLFNPASVVTLIPFWFLVGQGFYDIK